MVITFYDKFKNMGGKKTDMIAGGEAPNDTPEDDFEANPFTMDDDDEGDVDEYDGGEGTDTGMFDGDSSDDFDFGNPTGDDDDSEEESGGSGKKVAKDKDPNEGVLDKKLAELLRVSIPDAFKKLIEVAQTNLEFMSEGFRTDDIDFIIDQYTRSLDALIKYLDKLNNDDDYTRTETFVMFRGQFRALADEYVKVSDSFSSIGMQDL